MTRRAAAHVVAIGTLAGLAGGLAEIVWIWTYATLTNSDASLVARSVTDTMQFRQNISPVLSGVGIHMTLAAFLGLAVAIAMRSTADDLRGIRLYRSSHRSAGRRVGGKFLCRSTRYQSAICGCGSPHGQLRVEGSVRCRGGRHAAGGAGDASRDAPRLRILQVKQAAEVGGASIAP